MQEIEPNEQDRDPAQEGEADNQPADSPELRRIRREAGNLRARLRQAEQDLEAARAAHLAEADQLRKQVADAQTQMQVREATYRQQNARHQVENAARDLGIADPQAAWKLLEPSALQFDESGAPTNVGAALEALLREHPFLAGGPPRRVANPPRASGAPALSRQALARMTPEEINANWDAVSAQLAENKQK